ncbi:MAG: LPS assembly lipoprotein LptE [bacterium]
MKKKLAVFVALPFIIAGCSFSTPTKMILPDSIRNVKVEIFSNKTILYGLEDKLFQKISDDLLADGRLIPVTKNAEASIIGEIKKYELIPLSFDANSIVEEYKLWIEANFRFLDTETGNVLCEENNIPIDIRFYPPGSTRPANVIETEHAAQERAVKELSSEIIYQILRNK